MANRQDDIHTVAGKKKFLKVFLNSVRDELMGKAKDMPAEWNGFELRWLVCDKFEFEQHHRGRIAKQDAAGPWRKRVKNYENEVIVRNL